MSLSAFSWPIQVYYEDTDAAGLVYYANYLRFMERARTEWLRALGFEQTVLRDEYAIVFAVSRLEMEFLKPARFNDSLSVTVETARTGRASLDLLQRVLRGAEELICRGTVRIACVEAQTMRVCGIPAAVLTELDRVT